MKKIYKYELNYYRKPEEVNLPIEAQIIDYGIQQKAFKLWALVDPSKELERRVFLLAFTGQPLEYDIVKSYGTRIIEETQKDKKI